MITKKIDFIKNNSFNQKLSVIRDGSSDYANIIDGSILNSFYTNEFDTSAIFRSENDFLKKDSKNLVPFSFKYNKILVLTCSLAFEGGNTDGKNTIIKEGYDMPYYVGVADCFFQEKSKKDITSPYITNTDGFKQIKTKKEYSGPIYSYEIDVPIYGNGVQFILGDLSFSEEKISLTDLFYDSTAEKEDFLYTIYINIKSF
jgi:hypothetical protein